MKQNKRRTLRPSLPPIPLGVYDVFVLILFGTIMTSVILINLGVKVTSHIFAPRAYIVTTFRVGRTTLRAVISMLNDPPPISTKPKWLGPTREIGLVRKVIGPIVVIAIDPMASRRISLSNEIFIFRDQTPPGVNEGRWEKLMRPGTWVPCQVQQRLGQRSLVRILSCILCSKEGKMRVVALDSTDKIQLGAEVRGTYVEVPAGKLGLLWVIRDIINGFRQKRGTTWSLKNFKQKWVESWKIENGNQKKSEPEDSS